MLVKQMIRDGRIRLLLCWLAADN